MGRRFRRMRQEVVKVVRKMFLTCCCCGRFTGQCKVETFSFEKVLSNGFSSSCKHYVTECEDCSKHSSLNSSPEIIDSTHPDVTVLSSDKSSHSEQPLLVDYAADDFCYDIYPNGWSVKKTISRGEFGQIELVSFPEYEGKYVLKSCVSDKSEKDFAMLLKCQSAFVRKLYASFSINSERYMILDHCPFGNLNRLTKHGNAADEHTAAWTSAHLYAAADHIHSLGFVNLNIKPSNVLINRRGFPVLADFRNAQREVDSDIREVLSVNSAYTCPEVLRGQQPNMMTDFWAIACCCYQMLKRKSPYLGKTSAETETKICLGVKVDFYGLSLAASSFSIKEFNTDPERRLASRGISAIMTHTLFNGVDWKEIRSGRRSEKSPLLDLISSLHKNRKSISIASAPLSDNGSNCEYVRSKRTERRRMRPRKKRPKVSRDDGHSHRAAPLIDDGYLADVGELVDDTKITILPS